MAGEASGTGGQTPQHTWRPFEGQYAVMMPTAVVSMIPFIVTTSAWPLFSRDIVQATGSSPGAPELISSLATAAYAFGALMGGDIVQRFPQRRLFLFLEPFYVAGALIAASASSVWQMGIGMILQGLITGLMLVVALPPVVRRFPAGKMPITSAAINLGFFGAITAGPLLGGAIASGHLWRWYFGALAGVGLVVIAAAVMSLPDQPAPNPGQRLDWHAVLLGFGATFPPFYAAGVVQETGFAGNRFTFPLGVGLLCFVALILTQYHKREALAPVKPMWNTYPVVGTLIAMFGGGLFVSVLELGLRFLTRVERIHPLSAGLAFWPMLPGIVVSAALLGLLIRSRWLPVLVLGGMLCLVGAAWLLSTVGQPGGAATVSGTAALLGLGAGATVSPGLWLAGFSLPSKMVGRIFALVELVRSVADFILAPVILEVMLMASRSPQPTAAGIAQAAWYALLIAAGATALTVAMFLAGRPGLPQPDLDRWLGSDEPALSSPRFGGALRKAA